MCDRLGALVCLTQERPMVDSRGWRDWTCRVRGFETWASPGFRDPPEKAGFVPLS